MRKVTRDTLLILLTSSAVSASAAQQQVPAPESDLRSGFESPPSSARPRVWWHWMNGNITKEGIRKDIEWMSRIGIGGLQNFDAQLVTPQIVKQRLAYMTPEWKDAFRYAAVLAAEHKLELAIASSPGWSETGGPWVKPEDAMKKLVWSETIIRGGQRFTGRLAPIPTTAGPFQDMAKVEFGAAGIGKNRPAMGRDVAVTAFRFEAPASLPVPMLRSDGGAAPDGRLIVDNDLKTWVEIPRAKDGASLIAEYGAPQTIRSAQVYVPSAYSELSGPLLQGVLEAEVDGAWRTISDVQLGKVPTTVSFAPVKAARFRLAMKPQSGPTLISALMIPPEGVADSFPMPPPPRTIKVAELRLSGEARINAAELKSGFAVAPDYYALDANAGADVAGVAPASVVDLTGKMRPDGTLDWTPPPGRWKVLRFGYSLTGTTNHPATAEATGLEVDKYDGPAVRRYMETYLQAYAETIGPELIGKQGLRALVTDSTEVGPANWTPDLMQRFQALRGYDMRPWMPALTGVVVGSRSKSDAFLYDFRRTLADLHASEHYGTIAKIAHDHGLTVYGEALEDHRPVLGDDMAMRRYSDVPMAAFWTFRQGEAPRATFLADMKGAASVAHIYGQKLVAAESLTSAMSPWAFAPSQLKPFIDLEFASGVNRPVIHTSVHQPLDDKVPGLSLFIFGQYFNRHETWSEMAKPWIDYISRSSYMLQQGRNVADIAYFYGEEAPLTGLYGSKPVSDAPARNAYDFIDADALAAQLRVEGGKLVATGGARYQALYLGGSSSRMTFGTLRRIADLVEAGATVIGKAPEGSPSLADDPSAYQALRARLWSGAPVTTVGEGRVIASSNVDAALEQMAVLPDFDARATGDGQIRFVHRLTSDADIYFISNGLDRAEHLEARFRVTGKQPEIWRADTATTEPASYRQDEGQTIVPLDLLPHDALFVVFRSPAAAASRSLPKANWTEVGKIDGSWIVAFQPGRGAPGTITLDELQSLSDNSDPGIRYFSGVATYRKTFTAPRTLGRGAPAMLDLGRVADLAEVRVNGKSVGTVWKAPYRLDIASALRPGRNSIEIKVANRWINRLIGDAQPGATKITYTSLPTYKQDAPLPQSGLIGPVTLWSR